MEKTKKIITVILILFIMSVATAADAATLYFFPAQRTYDLNQRFSVDVILSSSDDASNAVSVSIAYPPDLIQVESFSKSGSILNLWPEDPTFSNTNGTFDFEGIILNPGYRGSAGKLITITFIAKRISYADLQFRSGSVLANDGKGTELLTSLGKASFTIQSPVKATVKSSPVETPTTSVASTSTSISISTSTSTTTLAATSTHSILYVPPVSDTAFGSFVKKVTEQLSLIVPLIGLIALLLLIPYYAFYLYRSLKKRVYRESLEAQQALGKSFKILRSNIEEHVELLISTKLKKKTNAEEISFLNQFNSDLAKVEKYIKREITDIEDISR